MENLLCMYGFRESSGLILLQEPCDFSPEKIAEKTHRRERGKQGLQRKQLYIFFNY